jgi:hypothetical protein
MPSGVLNYKGRCTKSVYVSHGYRTAKTCLIQNQLREVASIIGMSGQLFAAVGCIREGFQGISVGRSDAYSIHELIEK